MAISFTARFRIIADEDLVTRPLFALDEERAEELRVSCRDFARRELATQRLRRDATFPLAEGETEEVEETASEPTEGEILEAIEGLTDEEVDRHIEEQDLFREFLYEDSHITNRDSAYRLDLGAAGQEIEANTLDLDTLFYDWAEPDEDKLYEKLRAIDLLVVYAASLGRAAFFDASDGEFWPDHEPSGLEDSLRDQLAESGGGDCGIALTWVTYDGNDDFVSSLESVRIDTRRSDLVFLGTNVKITR